MKNIYSQIYTVDRLNALTDGVYAIVVTLLVLDLHTPETPGLNNINLLADLQEQTPNFIAYLISFFVVAFFWVRHNWTLKPVEKCSFRTFMLNFFHLLFVTLVPYTASLVGHYEQDAIAAIFFSGSIGLAAYSLALLHQHVVTKTEWHNKDSIKEWMRPDWLMMYPGVFFALGSILISFINVNAALALWLLFPVWVYFLNPQ